MLIVDDEEHIAAALEFLMQDRGYQTSVAHNGKQAVEKCLAENPDVVILDVMMPEMDGLQVAQKLREHEVTADVPIVFLTAKGTAADKLLGYQKGGDIYLAKPFDNEELCQIIDELLAYG